MNVDVQSEYHVKRINNGLGGLILEEVKVKPYIKDLSIYERAQNMKKNLILLIGDFIWHLMVILLWEQ